MRRWQGEHGGDGGGNEVSSAWGGVLPQDKQAKGVPLTTASTSQQGGHCSVKPGFALSYSENGGNMPRSAKSSML